jgi:hypothetical protein
MEAQLHSFLNSALDECDWSTSCSGGFTLGEKNPCTHLLGHRVGADVSKKR